MKSIVIFSFAVVFSLAYADPIRYYRQPIRASARQTDNGLAQLGETSTSTPRRESDDEEKSEQSTENAPYNEAGWRPSGQLLVLPFEVKARQNLESTTTVESSTFDDEQTTTENAAAEPATKGELETSEPKTKISAFKRPPLKVSGALKAQATTTAAMLGELETTSEPDSEAVDVEKSKDESAGNSAAVPSQPPVSQAPFQPAFFVQLPDESYQHIVYFPAQAPLAQQPTAANVQFQQLIQPQVTPFGFNPINDPRIVTFSSQYQAF